jgi:tetratricopeptide (TPR) repeat protein
MFGIGSIIELRLWSLVGSVLVIGGLVLCGYWARLRHLPEIAHAYQRRAEQLAAEGDWATAAHCLRRCLEIEPQRISAIVRLAEVLKELAITDGGRAVALAQFYRAVGLAPDCLPLRISLAELELELAHYDRAEYQARKVLEQVPDHDTALRLVGLASYHQFLLGEPKSEEEVVEAMQRALETSPGDIELAWGLATFYRDRVRHLEEPLRRQRADRILEDLVACQPDRALAYLTRHQYRKSYYLPGAVSDLDRALALAPEDPQVGFALGEHLLETGDSASAIALFEDLVERTQQTEAYLRLGQGYAAVGDAKRAASTWKEGLALDGESIQLRLEMVDLLLMQRQSDEAVEYLEELSNLVPRHLSIYQTHGNAAYWLETELLRARWHLVENRPHQAIDLLRMVTRMARVQEDADPREILLEAWHLLGRTYVDLAAWADAARAYGHAARLDFHRVETNVLAARMLATSGDRPAAIQYCRNALAETPDAGDLWLALADLQLEQQRHLVPADRNLGPVHQTLDRVEQLAPTDWSIVLFRADAWLLAETASYRQRAIRHLRDVEKKHPDEPEFWRQLVFRYDDLRDSASAERALAEFSRLVGDSPKVALLKARRSMDRGEIACGRETLQTLLATTSGRQRQEVLFLLSRLELQAGAWDDAYRYLLERQIENPANVETVWELGRLALKNQDWETTRDWESQLRRMEGELGCRWRWLKAFSLLGQIETITDPRFNQVEVLQFYIDAQNAQWPPGRLLKAAIAERQGRIDEAIAAYTDAVTAGVVEPLAYGRLIQLLCQQDQVELAQMYLRQVQQLLPPGLERTEVIRESEARLDQSQRLSGKPGGQETVPERFAATLSPNPSP